MADSAPSLVERLFAEQRTALQSFFRRRIRSTDDAADLAQEVYVRMLRVRDQDALRNPAHYLYTVANNLVKEHAVLQRHHARSIDIDEAPAAEQLETLPEFDGDLDTTQRGARLKVVLQELRPKCRAAVVLRFTHDLSYRRSPSTSVSPPRWRRNTWRRRWVTVNAAWRGWVEGMNSNDERIRAAIAEQAGEWFVAGDEAPLSAEDSAFLAAWLKDSPVHIEDFLGVSVIACELREAVADPTYSIDAMVALAQSEDHSPIPMRGPRIIASVRRVAPRRWLAAGVGLAACVVLSLGVLSFWNAWRIGPAATPDEITALHFETGHGQQLEQRLADGSVMHLNTDTMVTVRYGRAQRNIVLTAGQAEFEVAHDADRLFRVTAGLAEMVDVGTKFDVRLDPAATVVTVLEGRVAVQPATQSEAPATRANQTQSPRVVQLGANQQLSVDGRWDTGPIAVDAERATAWMHHQPVFKREPLERGAADFTRYAPKPFEIVTPALRSLGDQWSVFHGRFRGIHRLPEQLEGCQGRGNRNACSRVPGP